MYTTFLGAIKRLQIYSNFNKLKYFIIISKFKILQMINVISILADKIFLYFIYTAI